MATKCHFRKGLALCDLDFGHEGRHQDNWVMASGPMQFGDEQRTEHEIRSE